MKKITALLLSLILVIAFCTPGALALNTDAEGEDPPAVGDVQPGSEADAAQGGDESNSEPASDPNTGSGSETAEGEGSSVTPPEGGTEGEGQGEGQQGESETPPVNDAPPEDPISIQDTTLVWNNHISGVDYRYYNGEAWIPFTVLRNTETNETLVEGVDFTRTYYWSQHPTNDINEMSEEIDWTNPGVIHEEIRGIGRYKGYWAFSFNTYQDIIFQPDNVTIEEGAEFPESFAVSILNGGPLEDIPTFEYIVTPEVTDSSTPGVYRLYVQHVLDPEDPGYFMIEDLLESTSEWFRWLDATAEYPEYRSVVRDPETGKWTFDGLVDPENGEALTTRVGQIFRTLSRFGTLTITEKAQPPVDPPAEDPPADPGSSDPKVTIVDVPKTGDTANVIIFAGLTIMSALALTGIVLVRKKARSH